MKKKIFILGAGVWQLSGISKLIRSGYKVYVADTRKNLLEKLINVKKFHINSYKISELLNLIKKNKISTCISFNSDFAVPIINKLNKKLGNNFYPNNIISTLTEKISFRNFQKMNNFNHPYFLSDYKRIINHKNYKNNFIIKSNISSGSKGIFTTNTISKKSIFIKKCQNSKNNSLDSKIIFEKKIKGREYGGNCFIKDKKIVDIRITKKILKRNIVIGHIYPSNLNELTKAKIKKQLTDYIEKLNLDNSIINFDLKIFKKKIFVIELALRGGGNGLTDVIKYSSNLDYDKINYEKRIDQPKKKDSFFYCSYIFGSNIEGHIKLLNLNLNNYEFVLKKYIFKNKNEKVHKFMNNPQAIGMIIFKIKKLSDFYKKKYLFDKKIKLLILKDKNFI